MMRDEDRAVGWGLFVGLIFCVILAGLILDRYSDKEHNSAVIDGDKISSGLSEAEQLEIIQYIQKKYPENAIYTEKYPRMENEK